MSNQSDVIDLVDSDSEESLDSDIIVLERKRPLEKRTDSTGVSLPPPTKKSRIASANKVEVDTFTLAAEGSSREQGPSFESRIAKILIDAKDDATVTPGELRLPVDKNGNCSSISITQHIQQADKWSCGYRNLQMMLSAILPHLPAHHTFYQKVPSRKDHISIPSLRQIQSTLENAWNEGYDQRGAQHFGGRLLGKRSWLGAVEVSSVLSYWGIDAAVVQFIRCRKSRSLLSKFILNYFGKYLGKETCPFCSQRQNQNCVGSIQASKRLLEAAESPMNLTIEPECSCPILPVYIQWEGHSVSIVGVEGNDTLLLFDPLKKPLSRHVKTKQTPQVTPTRLSMKKLEERDTQVIIVSTFQSLSASERQARMGEKHILTAAEADVMKSLRL